MQELLDEEEKDLDGRSEEKRKRQEILRKGMNTTLSRANMTTQQGSLCVFQTGLPEPTSTCQVSVFITFFRKKGTIATTLDFCSGFGQLHRVYDRHAGWRGGNVPSKETAFRQLQGPPHSKVNNL